MNPINSEFSFLPDVSGAFGYPFPPRHYPRRVDLVGAHGPLSAIWWGEDAPQVAFLHGGGQNAHTWDAVALGLGAPALALDLPGHGRSPWRTDHDYSPRRNAEAIAPALLEAAPDVSLVVGMSLGGLTAIALSALHPELTRRVVIVDILPQIPGSAPRLDEERLAALRRSSSRRHRGLDELTDEAMKVSPLRSRESVSRGVRHNAVQDPDGLWRWRYDPQRRSGRDNAAENDWLWDVLRTVPPATTLVQGACSTVVEENALRRLKEIAPRVEVISIPGAGHAVQSDRPRELADVLRRRLRTAHKS
jgi:esterase